MVHPHPARLRQANLPLEGRGTGPIRGGQPALEEGPACRTGESEGR
jgi:hypothetical protein